MRKLFLVFLLIQVGLFAQLNNTNKWMMRGDDTKLSFAYSKGSLTNDTLIFAVKATKDITEIRLIEKTTYNSQISLSGTKPAFIFVTLEAGDTDDLTLARYFYDITRIHNGDTTTIIIGDLYIQPDIGTPFDGTDVTGRVTTVSLNNGTTLNSVIVWDTTNQYWKPMSFSTFESLINVSPGSLPDSVLFSSDTTDQRTFSDLKYVDKTTAQTITGQKNFSGTVKFRSDSSISMGGLVGSYALGLDYYLKTANSYQIPLRFNVLDANTAAWTIASGEVDFTPSLTGKDHVFNMSYNFTGSSPVSQFGQQMEAFYEANDTSIWYEWFTYYNDLPAPNTNYQVRPLQIGTLRYGSSAPYRYTSSVGTHADYFFISGETGESLIEFRTPTYGATTTQSEKWYSGTLSNALGNSMMYIMDSLWIFHNKNNFGWLYQARADGSARELMRIDDNDRLLLAPSTETPIDFRSSIYGTIYWTDEAGTGEVPIYKESGRDRIYIGGGDGMVTNKLEVTNIPQDTTDLPSGQFYIDNLTGSVQYTMPENLVTNGDFKSWTGTSKGATPNGWTFAPDPRDTTAIYIEQNPTGKLHYVWDGSTRDHYLVQSQSTIGVNYGYSFEVSTITDSALIYIVGNPIAVTSAGFYSGSFESIWGDLFVARSFYGAGEITLDDIRIWEIGGNIDAPTYDVPVILDSLGAEIALIEVGSFDTTHIYMVTDSLAEDIAAIEVGEFTIPDSVVYAGELTSGLAGKFNIADTTNLHALKLANKLDDSDTTSLLAMQWELDGKQASGLSVLKTDTTALHYTKLADKINYSDTTALIAMQWELDGKQATGLSVLKTDTTALHYVKLAGKLNYSDTTSLVAMQWELDGKLSSLPDSVVFTSEISGDSIIGTANTLDSLITDYWNGTIGSTDTTFIYQRLAEKLAYTDTTALHYTKLADKLNVSDSTIYATQYDLTQLETGGGLSEGDVNTLINTAINDLIDTSGYYVSKVEMFTASGVAMSVNPDSGDLLIINVSGMDNYTDEGGLRLVFTSIDSILAVISTATGGDFIVPVSMMGYVLALDSGATDFGIYSAGNGYINDQTATVITLKKGVLVSGSGSGMTDEQLQEHEYMWTYLALDTTGSIGSFTDSTGAPLSTTVTSYPLAVTANDVARISVSTGEYRAYSNSSWTSWYTTERKLKDVDSVQVRHTSSSSNNTATTQTIYVSNDSDVFSVTTLEAGGGAHVTDSLEYYGNIDSLASGIVDVWEDEITVLQCIPFGLDTTNRPIRSGNDVWFFSDDLLESEDPPMNFTGDMTIEIVAEFSDSSTCEIFTVRSSARLMSFSFQGNRFCVSAWGGGDVYNYNVYSDTVMGRHHIVATWDGVNEAGITLYVDNVVVPTMGNSFGLFGDPANIYLGGPSGSMLFSMPLWRVYSDELTSGEVETNYDSDSVQDLMP